MAPAAVLRSLLFFLPASAVVLSAASFRVDSAANLRVDARVPWAAFATVDGVPIPSGTSIDTTDEPTSFTVFVGDATNLTISNPDHAVGLPVSVANSGPDSIYLYPSHGIQGIGMTFSRAVAGPATYHIDCYGSDGVLLTSVSAPASGVAGGTTFLGVVDPQSRIDLIGIHADPDGAFTLSDPLIELPAAAEDVSALPVTGETTITVSPTVTYLHQGLSPDVVVPSTDAATVDNANAHNLFAAFPAMAAGDVLRFERLGMAIPNGVVDNVLGVFSSTEHLGSNREYRRLDGALKAGRDFYTSPIVTGPFPTPTNIPEDFVIGESSFVTVPVGARYLMTTLATPTRDAGPVDVRISYIPRRAFEDWVASQGLYGANADLDSDLDGDGLTLIEEYAFRKDPTVPDAGLDKAFSFAPKLDPTAPSDRIGLLFGGRLNSPVRYHVEFSSDLIDWQEVDPGSLQPMLVSSNSDQALFRVLDPLPGPHRFARVRLEYTPPPTAP